MSTFWTWCVRNPALLLGVVFFVSGYGGVDWSAALSGAAVCALVAKSASTLSTKAQGRAEARAGGLLDLDAFRATRLAPQHSSRDRAA